MEANERQVGGSHYAAEYQHWDFVCDAKLHYLLGCASKYVSRWRKKNGKEDLEKAIHYFEKAIEQNLKVASDLEEYALKFCRVNNLRLYERVVLLHMARGEFRFAVEVIKMRLLPLADKI